MIGSHDNRQEEKAKAYNQITNPTEVKIITGHWNLSEDEVRDYFKLIDHVSSMRRYSSKVEIFSKERYEPDEKTCKKAGIEMYKKVEETLADGRVVTKKEKKKFNMFKFRTQLYSHSVSSSPKDKDGKTKKQNGHDCILCGVSTRKPQCNYCKVYVCDKTRTCPKVDANGEEMKDKEGKPILVTASDTCFNQWHQIHVLTKLSQYKYKKNIKVKNKNKNKKRKFNDTLVSTEEQTTNKQACFNNNVNTTSRSLEPEFESFEVLY